MIILRQNNYAAFDKKGNVVKTSIEALNEARDLGYTKKQAVQAARRILGRAESDANSKIDSIGRFVRPRMGFSRTPVSGVGSLGIPIGFKSSQIESTGNNRVPLGFRK